MLTIYLLMTWLRCRLRWCGGHVVSGFHDGHVWVGWRCDHCGIVKYYARTDD
jgi:hypothetical protein